MPDLHILVVGNTDRAEFREAREALDRWGRVIAAEDAGAAAAVLARGESPADLIIVAQAFPGQFSAEAVDALRRLAPLARVVVLLGSWCEGETRTGRAWPGAIRVYWHQWVARAERELKRLREGRCSAWSLPSTASEEEQILVSAEEPLAQRQGLIAIYSARFEAQDWLAAACRRAGFTAAWLRPDRIGAPGPARIVLFDATDGRGEELEHLRRLSAGVPSVPVVALVDFPRVEDRDRLLAAGAAAVLSKPLSLEDLFWQLDQAKGSGVVSHVGEKTYRYSRAVPADMGNDSRPPL